MEIEFVVKKIVRECQEWVALPAPSSRSGTTELRLTSVGERYLKILTWLSEMPFASHHAYFNKHRRHDTGGWLLEHQKYGEWKMSDESSIFWLRGSRKYM